MKELRRRGVVGALALLLDMLLQELPERWSPAATAVVGMVLGRTARHMPSLFGIWGEAALLSTTLGMNSLRRQVINIDDQLALDDLAGARATGAHLLERETAEYDQASLASATVAAIADGTSDEVVAPLFYYVVAGLPGAMFYRLVLSLRDSLGAYRDEIVGYLRVAPSRVTSCLFIAASYIVGENGARAMRIWQRDAAKARDSNRTHPRSAMAGALGIELDDPEVGSVGVGERQPNRLDISRATRLMRAAVALGAGLLIGLPLIARNRK